MELSQIVSIAQKSGQMFEGAGGVYREQTEIGVVEAYSKSVKVATRNGHGTYRTTWMLNGKRISHESLCAKVRATNS